jgi:long-subunit fatty acid transport protein
MIFISVVAAMAITSSVSAQRVEIPSSLNPVGSGARAVGVGGAFIAVADDATAASWNPGGLIQLERPEISVVGAGFHRTEDNTFRQYPEADGAQEVDKIDLNYFSAAYPFHMKGYNMIVSINYQKLYDFSREWELDLHREGSNYSEQEKLDYKQSGDLSAISLAYSMKVRPRFSLGFTLNFWGDYLNENGWKEHTNQSGSGMYDGEHGVFDISRTDRYCFSGINANFGLLWQAAGSLTLGAVFKSPFTADIEHTRSQYYSFYFPDSEENRPTVTQTNEDLTLTMPMSYGIGAAYRFSDAFSLSLDLYRTHWNDFEWEDQSGNRTSPITGKPSGETDVDPTIQVRLGGEYLIILPKLVIPIRGGIFYDPAPAEGTPDDFYGCSIGSGLVFDRIAWDIAWQYRYGNDVSEAIMPGYGFSQDVRQITVYFSIIVYI